MMDRRRSAVEREILRSADNDEWFACLRSAVASSPNLRLNDVRTPDGDRLVHLAAFAACEKSQPLRRRRAALAVLEIVLDREGTRASQRRAHDGGTALHAALAAAATEGEEEDDETEGEEEDDEDALPVDARGSTSREIPARVVRALCEAGADPDARLTSPPRDDDDDEIEDSNYAREAVDEGWTPLAFAVVWIATSTSDDDVAAAIAVTEALLEAGADPSLGPPSRTPRDRAASCLAFRDGATRRRVDALLSTDDDDAPSPAARFLSAALRDEEVGAPPSDVDATTTIGAHLPIPRLVFGRDAERVRDDPWLVGVAATGARDAVRSYLASAGPPSTESERGVRRDAVARLCLSRRRRQRPRSDDRNTELLRLVLDHHRDGDDRRLVLDELLLAVCAAVGNDDLSYRDDDDDDDPGPPTLALLLSAFDADPRARRARARVAGGHGPLHLLVGGRRRDDEALRRCVATLARADPAASRETNDDGRTPRDVAERCGKYQAARVMSTQAEEVVDDDQNQHQRT